MESLVFQFAPLPNAQAIEKIALLEPAQFDALRQAVLGEEGFNREFKRCRQLAEQLNANFTARQVYNILGALKYLYERLHEAAVSKGSVEESLHEILELSGINEQLRDEFRQAGYERLLQLLAEQPSIESANEVNWLQTGILNTAIDFASFVDFRPRYSSDFSDIEDIVEVVILRVAVTTEYGPNKSHVFQISKEGLRVLRTMLDDIDTQLATADARLNQVLGRRPSRPTS